MSVDLEFHDLIMTALTRHNPAAIDDYYPETATIWTYFSGCTSRREVRRLVFEALEFWHQADFDEPKAEATVDELWSTLRHFTEARCE